MPSVECGQYIETQTTSYPCDLNVNHKGPHSSVDIPVSVRRRERWEAAQGQLAEFQGPAETTAERYTVNPTPVPGSEVIIEDHVKGVEPSDDDEDMRVTRSEDFAPTKQRPGDQRLPDQREGDEIVQKRIVEKARQLHEDGGLGDAQLAVIEQMMEESIKVGVERYGTPLQTFNGRDILQDIVDEARDLFVYLSSAQQARENDEEKIVQLVIDQIYRLNNEGVEITVESIVRESVRYVLDAFAAI